MDKFDDIGEDIGKYLFSPVYDLLPVNVIMPEHLKERFAVLMEERNGVFEEK